MSEFLRDLVKQVKDPYTSIASDGLSSGEFTGYVDTGCYMLNAVLSGSIYGGVPNNKVTGFAGASSTGKTYFVLEVVKSFLANNPTAVVVYYDTEAAVTKEMMSSRGMDTSRIIIAEPDTIQKFRHHAIKLIDAYMETPVKTRPPMLFVLDSLGMLSTSKEMEDTAEGKDTRDMTKAQILKACFRVLTLRLAKAKIPMLCTNHVYAAVGAYVPTDVISGGSGFLYAASTIGVLSKKKNKDGTDVIGNIITVKMYKSRLSKENSQVSLKLSYKTGLDKYYGLLELAEKAGIFTKVSTRYEMPTGEKVFAKAIENNPEKYYTKEILDQLDIAANKFFAYGSGDDESVPLVLEGIDYSEEDETED